MKKTFALCGAAALALCLGGGLARADLDLPRPSPFAKVVQTVGLTDITVDYSSPGVKGRKIWGGARALRPDVARGRQQRHQDHLQPRRHLRRQAGAGRDATRFFVIPTQGGPGPSSSTRRPTSRAPGATTSRADDLLRVAGDAQGGAVPRAAGLPDHRLHRRQGDAGARVGEAAPADPDQGRDRRRRRWPTSTAPSTTPGAPTPTPRATCWRTRRTTTPA